MRNTTVQTVLDLANEGVDLHFLTADLGFKILDPFRAAHPGRFTNVGVSEANMISVAAGLALSGKRPVCYSMVPFLFMRAFEQVRLDVVAAKLPVLLVGVGGGLSYGHEGMSHHAIEDLAMARSLPGLRVIAPGDPRETEAAVRLAMSSPGPTFLRLGRNGDPVLHPPGPVDVTRATTLANDDAADVIVATGHVLAEVLATAKMLLEQHGRRVRVVTLPMIKPVDQEFIRLLARTARSVATVEEHSVVGGLGSLVTEELFAGGFRGRFLKIGLPDEYCETHGTHDWLRRHYGIDAASLTRKMLEHLPQ